MSHELFLLHLELIESLTPKKYLENEPSGN